MRKQLIFAVAALCFAACSNDENTVMGDGPVTAQITAGLNGQATRAMGSSWNNDHIGVMVTEAPNSDMEDLYKNVHYSTSSTGTTAEFFCVIDRGIFFQDASETVTFSAYAPYQSSSDNATLPGTNGVVTVNTQTNNTAALQESIDFLYAEGATASKQSPTVTFTNTGSSDCSFHHRMAQLNITFQTPSTAGFAASDIFDTDNTFYLGGLIHEGTFDVTSGATATTGNSVSSWDITGCNHTDNSTARTYSLILLPQNLSSSPLTVSVSIDGQTYSNSTAIAPDLEPGKSYNYIISVNRTELEVEGSTITGWDGNTIGGIGNAVM